MRYKYDSTDSAIIEGHLRSMSEYYGRSIPSDGVLSRWLEQLAEDVPPHCAATVLADWTKRRDNYPTIAGVLKEARALKEREDERRQEAIRNDPSIPKVSGVRPYNPDMADAVDRAMKAIFALGPRPDAFWEWEGIAHLDTIGFQKRRYLEEKYGDRLKDPDFIRGIKDKVRNRIYLEQQLPKPSDLLVRKQAAKADAWEFGA